MTTKTIRGQRWRNMMHWRDMMHEHTPGPWRAFGTTIVTLNDSNTGPIATTQSTWVTQRGCEANARLIAAAPEMLSLLKQISETSVFTDASIRLNLNKLLSSLE